MSYWTSNALRRLPLPPALLSSLAATQAAKYASDLAQNPALGDAALDLLKVKLKADDVAGLAINGSYALVDQLLSTPKEKRDTVLDAIRDRWDLNSADQLRFVSRRLSANQARGVLQDDRFSDQAKLLAARYAEPAAAAHWMNGCSLPDDVVFDFVVSYLGANENAWTNELVNLLMNRPSLRSRFVSAPHARMIEACAWVELEPSDQEKLGEYLLNATSFSGIRPLLGALSSPWTTPELRQAYWARAKANESSSYYDTYAESLRYALPSPGSPLWVGTALRDITTAGEVELLVSFARGLDHDDVFRTLQAEILIELSANALCATPELSRRVLTALLGLSTYSAAYRSTVNRTFATLSEKVESDPERRRELLVQCGLGYAHHSNRDETDARNQAQRCAVLERSVHANRRRYGLGTPSVSPEADYAKVATIIPKENHLGNHQMNANIVAYLTERLGQADSPHSLECWSLFFEMSSTNPGATLETLAATATKMASLSKSASNNQ